MKPGPIKAGLTLFTLIPNGARSLPAVYVIDHTAPLLDAYAIMLGGQLVAALLAVFTMLPLI